jgi:hypothetical protein
MGAVAQLLFTPAGRNGYGHHEDDGTSDRDSQGIWSNRAEISDYPGDA